MGSGITGSWNTSHGIRISSFLEDQELSCTIFVGSGTKICDAFGISDQKLGCNGINDEKTYLVTTPIYGSTTPFPGGLASKGQIQWGKGKSRKV